MGITYSESLLRLVSLKICTDVGFDTAHQTVLDFLGQLLINYIRKIGISAVEYANHRGSSHPSLADLAMAFQHLNIDLRQLKDFVLNVDSSPIPIKLTFYPLTLTKQNRVLNNVDWDEERVEYYDEWLPTLKWTQPTKLPELECELNENTTNDTFVKEKDENLKNSDDSKQNENKPETNSEDTSTDVKVDPSQSQKNDTSKIDGDGQQDVNLNKERLVLRLSLSKSFEENGDEEGTANQTSESSNQPITEAITNRLKSSRAFMRFLQSSLYKNPESLETRRGLRSPDTQRLLNNHQSRGNTPEPEPISSANLLNGDVNMNNLPDGNLSELESLQKSMMKLMKKKKKRDVIDPLAFDDDPFVSKIKVKDIIPKKERKKLRPTDEVIKQKRQKQKKGISIKVTGFGLDDLEKQHLPINEVPLFADVPPDLAAALFDSSTASTKPTKQAKQPKPKKLVKKKAKLQETLVNENTKVEFLEEGELPPSPDRSRSPAKWSKQSLVCDDLSYDDVSSNQLAPLSESNDADDQNKFVHSIINNNELDGDSKGPGSSKSKKVRQAKERKPTKREKCVTPNKIKSAEIVESSDSSGDEANVVSNTVSLGPLPSQDFPPNTTVEPSSFVSRKRRHSGSSVSSVHSSISSHASLGGEVSVEHDFNLATSSKPTKSNKEDKTKLLKEDKKEKRKKKHKDKKHREEKEKHKKHKKTKLDKESTDKHREKDKEKRPKLNIKLGPNLEIKNSPNELKNEPSLTTSEVVPTVNPVTSSESNRYSFEKNDQLTSKKKIKKSQPECQNEIISIKDELKPTSKKSAPATELLDEVTSMERGDNVTKVVKPKKDNKDKDSQKKEAKHKKVKNLPSPDISLEVKADKKAAKHTKKEKVNPNKKGFLDNKSCTLIRETIDINEPQVWFCPGCGTQDDGQPMICCDNCDNWYHYQCVGITNDPEVDSWFCKSCIEKKNNRKEVFSEIKKNDKGPIVGQNVSITPISNIIGEVSITPVLSSPTEQGSKLVSPNMTITSTSSYKSTSNPRYKPTGRPRGRPRKDSTLSRKPSVTITPIEPSTQPVEPLTLPTTPSLSSSSSFPHKQQSITKRNKNICPECNISDRLNMIMCNKCNQWYHWDCIDITPSLGSSSKWLCLKCRKKSNKKRSYEEIDLETKSHEPLSLTDAKFLAATNRGKHSFEPIMTAEDDYDPLKEDNDNETWRCGTCGGETASMQDEIQWIGCDSCDQWYHFTCEGITQAPPSDESWFCGKCIAKQKTLETRLAKIKRI